MQGKARLRGLYRIISSKTIRPRLSKAKPACAGYTGLFLQRPYALGYPRRSPPARAIPDYFFKDHTPSAIQGEARLRGTRTPMVTLSTIGYRLCKAKPACVERELQRRPSRPSAIGYRLSVIGYARQSPPAWNANSNGDPLDHRLSAIGYRLSTIGYRLSAIGDDQPSALEGEACLRGLYWILFLKFIILIAACGA
jgi:hypothetical protein